uniref:Global nitrogen transcriptional regulator n=1 Tax=Symphyocladiella dendroidea TaxID=2506487 RepID=A0A1Z1M7N5_9FLOR|nr:global nitrogen transcriptional regulator [Symphyocladiella dendroidea]ARW61970.1 global nitrogen transcriptional regulator [Symphyocladiella dendroidea]
MKWIKLLKQNKIPYYIYRLKEEDFIILNKNNSNIIIILSGIVFITKVFPNKELLPIAILNKHNILIKSNKESKIYYKIVALERAYILTLSEYNLNKSKNILIEINILNSYNKTIGKYEAMNNIMSQKQIKNRILQLIFTICLQFGKVESQKIFIPFKLSNKNIAILTGTSEHTVNKVIRKIYKQGIIKEYNNKVISINNILYLNLK